MPLSKTVRTPTDKSVYIYIFIYMRVLSYRLKLACMHVFVLSCAHSLEVEALLQQNSPPAQACDNGIALEATLWRRAAMACNIDFLHTTNHVFILVARDPTWIDFCVKVMCDSVVLGK